MYNYPIKHLTAKMSLLILISCMACSQASDHRNKISRRRQSVLLCISEASVDYPGTTYPPQNSVCLAYTCCSWRPPFTRNASFDFPDSESKRITGFTASHAFPMVDVGKADIHRTKSQRRVWGRKKSFGFNTRFKGRGALNYSMCRHVIAEGGGWVR